MVHWRYKKTYSRKSAILEKELYPNNRDSYYIYINFNDLHKLIQKYIIDENGNNNYNKILDLYLRIDNYDSDDDNYNNFNETLENIILRQKGNGSINKKGYGKMNELVSHILNDGKRKKLENINYKTYKGNNILINNYNSDYSD